MKYIVHKRFKDIAICGKVNLPATTSCICEENIILYDGKPICINTSENAHQYFAIDEDGNGLERGKLTQEIQKRLSKRDSDYQKRWDKVWEDKICQKYKREDFEDYWIWNHDFFNASIWDLKYIKSLIN